MELHDVLGSDSMGSYQTILLCRLCLIFIFTAFEFFLDLFSIPVYPSCSRLNTNESRNDFQHEKEFSNFSQHRPAHQRMQTPSSGLNGSIPLGTLNGSHLMDVKCDEHHVIAYGQTMFMTGLLLCSIVGGIISDRYGRKGLLLGSVTIQAVLGLMLAFIPHAIFYLLTRLLTGMTCCGIMITSFSLVVEWSAPKHRVWPPAILSLAFSIGMMVFAGIAFITSDWQQLHLATSVPQLVCLIFYWYIPESPRWLLANANLDNVKELLKKAAKVNGISEVDIDSFLVENNYKERNGIQHNIPANASSAFMNFSSGIIILRLFVMSYISFVIALTYYGVSFNIGSFGVNIFLAQFFSGLVETPQIVVPCLLERFGRRWVTCITLLLTGCLCLLSLLVSTFIDMPFLIMALALLGKLCVQTSCFVSTLYNIELFPTVIRQKCIGFVGLWYRIGSMLTGLVAPNGSISLSFMISFGIMPLLGAVLCLFLPETKFSALPDTVQDCQRQLGLLSCYRRKNSTDSNERNTDLALTCNEDIRNTGLDLTCSEDTELKNCCKLE
ncbi:solute carrier family 22 member 13 [Callorhinchus milii]|uniref:solute carrier family 22 member 13 n=1 Tax=Callorhinchus milii TaxID=7868 RepID=UPI0004575886|nr:solute carrier family 22 member 13 [Callorhinchus milii]|eukprot:gi/632953064/ref/XP_007892203.1/ PREDICTED: solute carrier family 22 member 13-like [Callorhinchus milii]